MASEVPKGRIWLMSDTSRSATRPNPRRPTPTRAAHEGRRLGAAIAASLGGQVRQARRRKGLTQEGLAERVGLHPTRISQIEAGSGTGVPLDVWCSLGVVLDQPFAATFSRELGAVRGPLDSGHLDLQELLLALARATGRTGGFELPTRPSDPSRSVDVCVRDDRHRVLILEEAWNTFGDIGAAVRSTRRKLVEAERLGLVLGGDRPFRAAAVWVVRDSATNRAIIARYPGLFGSTFTGSSELWARSIRHGSVPPAGFGLVWADPATGRVTAWRQRRSVTHPPSAEP
jgi:transcriptional regulator with XRE-family HTH domain